KSLQGTDGAAPSATESRCAAGRSGTGAAAGGRREPWWANAHAELPRRAAKAASAIAGRRRPPDEGGTAATAGTPSGDAGTGTGTARANRPVAGTRSRTDATRAERTTNQPITRPFAASGNAKKANQTPEATPSQRAQSRRLSSPAAIAS